MNILSYTNCIVNPTLGTGKIVLMFSQGMRELGHTVEVCPPEDYETWHGLRRAIPFRQAWGSLHSVNRKLKSGKYDILEFYGTEFWLPTWRLSKSKRRPFIVAHSNGLELLARERSMLAANSNGQSVRSRFHGWFFRQTHSRFLRTAFAYADAFVALCERDRQDVLSLGLCRPDRTVVVEPGIDEEYLSVPFSPLREERVAFNGTLITRKGIDKLVTVMTRLMTRNPNLHFDAYGTWWSYDKMLNFFPPELHSRIAVYSNLSNGEMACNLSRAKVFFFPTRYEGFGIALAEAMACGCAAVTTPTGFGADLRNGEEALICDFDDVEGMEHAVLKLLKGDYLRQNISRKGRERVQSLNWETSTKKLEAIYSEWVKHHNGNKIAKTAHF